MNTVLSISTSDKEFFKCADSPVWDRLLPDSAWRSMNTHIKRRLGAKQYFVNLAYEPALSSRLSLSHQANKLLRQH